jgi:hypothetical protein
MRKKFHRSTHAAILTAFNFERRAGAPKSSSGQAPGKQTNGFEILTGGYKSNKMKFIQ